MIKIYSFICFMMWTIQIMIIFFYYDMFLTPYNGKLNRIKRTCIVFTVTTILMWIKVIMFFFEPFSFIIVECIVWIISVVFVLLFYKDKFKIKVFYILFIAVQSLITNIITFSLVCDIENGITSIIFNEIELAKVSVVATLMFLAINMASALIILKYQRKMNISFAWALMVFCVILVAVAISYKFNTLYSDLYLAFVSIFTGFIFVAIVMYIILKDQYNTEEAFMRLTHVMEKEKAYYEQVEKKTEEMAKIRHDYNNVIVTVRSLVEDKKYNEALGILNELYDKSSATSEVIYSPVSIINAVLNEKKDVCDREDIEMNVDLMIPCIVEVSKFDLCVIFGNLIDNAIRACREVTEQGGKSKIYISGKKINEYILFKVKNTALEDSGKVIKGTGYGQKILSDIAKRYNGDFKTMYSDGVYTACISLRMSQTKNKI